jgi:hypothetical protein
VELVYRMPFDVHLRKVQDIFFAVALLRWDEFKQKAAAGDTLAGQWSDLFSRLGDKLLIRLG